MRILFTENDAQFRIAADTTAPAIEIRTDADGPHDWEWSIVWKAFRKHGATKTPDNRLDAGPLVEDLGGALLLRASAAGQSARLAVKVIGTNPPVHDVLAYLASKPESDGFAAIIQHEAHSQHFTAAGEPKKSFDNGYGICQLTTPAPTYEQCWNWKRDIDAGLLLFAEKRRAAITYLGQQNRTYTPEQLRRETVSRWNGGAYHQWDGSAWARNADILCDSATGNVGWDTSDTQNADQREADLHTRDRADYRRGRQRGDPWIYSGVCYADALLG